MPAPTVEAALDGPLVPAATAAAVFFFTPFPFGVDLIEAGWAKDLDGVTAPAPGGCVDGTGPDDEGGGGCGPVVVGVYMDVCCGGPAMEL